MARLAALVTLILSLCMALVIFVARQQPLPPRLAMLHLTDCELPCWIGITPGVTPADQVKARIEAVYGSSNGYLVTEQTSTATSIRDAEHPEDRAQITIQWLSNPTETNTWLNLSTDVDLEIGDVVNLLGTPSGAAIMSDEGEIVTGLYYGDTIVAVRRARDEPPFPIVVSPHDKMDRIAFTVSDFAPYAVERWHGFGVAYPFDTP